MSKSKDKTLQAIIKLKDEISGPLKNVMTNMEKLNKSTTASKKAFADFEGGMKQVGKSAVKTVASVGGWVAGAALGTKIGAAIGSIIPGAGHFTSVLREQVSFELQNIFPFFWSTTLFSNSDKPRTSVPKAIGSIAKKFIT